LRGGYEREANQKYKSHNLRTEMSVIAESVNEKKKQWLCLLSTSSRDISSVFSLAIKAASLSKQELQSSLQQIPPSHLPITWLLQKPKSFTELRGSQCRLEL
jgi:hypothetical protein